SSKNCFLDDLRSKNMFQILRNMKKAILVLHSPQDRVVGIDNAAQIYHAAYHPKSYITLDGADHMLSRKQDAAYTGNVISTWVSRYIEVPKKEVLRTSKQVVARLTADAGYTTEIMAGDHGFIADEPTSVGGNDYGPDPYELLSSSLAACTAMTLRMYAQRKKWPLEDIFVHINHHKKYFEDCQSCEKKGSKIDHFERCIELAGDLTVEQKQRLLEIADRCPVHRTLHKEVRISTILQE
ncbi:MAG: OsmC family protein, partial [Bacteroidota bacterium]